MDFSFTPDQERIREAVTKLCAQFGDEYWLKKDREGGFPSEVHAALAKDGWLGIAMPEEFGGSGLGIAEAAVMMQAIAESGAGFSGASAVHMNIFGLNPVVVFGNESQKQRMLPGLIAGKERACFAVTEPNAGLDTAKIATTAQREGERYVLRGQKIWTSTAQVAHKVLILARTTPPGEIDKRRGGGARPTGGSNLGYNRAGTASRSMPWLKRMLTFASAAVRRASMIACSSTSVATIALAPLSPAATASTPVPQPMSQNRAPGSIRGRSMRASEKVAWSAARPASGSRCSTNGAIPGSSTGRISSSPSTSGPSWSSSRTRSFATSNFMPWPLSQAR